MNAIETQKIDQLLEAIKSLTIAITTPKTAPLPAEKSLWDSASCAAYFCVTQQHFLQRMACTPDFPSAINIAGTRGARSRRWRAGDVIAWAENRREKKRA